MKKDYSLSMEHIQTLYCYNKSLMLESQFKGDRMEYMQDITRKIVDTEDALIKKGLKKLGWISPDEAKRIQNLLRRVAGTQSFYRCGWEGVDPEVKDLLTEVFNDTEND